jgi:hypothetical protein
LIEHAKERFGLIPYLNIVRLQLSGSSFGVVLFVHEKNFTKDLCLKLISLSLKAVKSTLGLEKIEKPLEKFRKTTSYSRVEISDYMNPTERLKLGKARPG